MGRTLARMLHANEDLTECICLAHDLGHSPFGHEGERVLNDLMADHGGFDHNLQSLRCVEVLESPYPTFAGLNLSWEVRAGLLKHEADRPGHPSTGHRLAFQSLEAQIADIADDLTYQAHDVDDGLEAGIVTLAQLEETRLWQQASEIAKRVFPPLIVNKPYAPPCGRSSTCRSLMSLNKRRSDSIRFSLNQLKR